MASEVGKLSYLSVAQISFILKTLESKYKFFAVQMKGLIFVSRRKNVNKWNQSEKHKLNAKEPWLVPLRKKISVFDQWGIMQHKKVVAMVHKLSDNKRNF